MTVVMLVYTHMSEGALNKNKNMWDRSYDSRKAEVALKETKRYKSIVLLTRLECCPLFSRNFLFLIAFILALSPVKIRI